jgi:glycosyltransferase involved in cell wall biosynthesis
MADPTEAARDQLRTMTAAWRPFQGNAPGLVGRACPCAPPVWHLQRLLERAPQEEPNSAVEQARRLYHARWLGHLLIPDCAEFRPIVTILIPVYNRAAMVADAVESCLAQTWRSTEILIVDDGSTDDLAGSLARFGAAVRVIRQANGGVSRARNTGIRAASGDFVHFLDSDNLLLPAAVARKVDGFARYPDAELCYSLAEIQGNSPTPSVQIDPPDGSAHCPTVSLLAGRNLYPFYVSCVMLPRYTLLATGGFEEDLRRWEDVRLWIRLGLRDTKVIGLDDKLTVRRLSSSSLSATPLPRDLHLLARGRTITDLLGNWRAWKLAAWSFPGLLQVLLQDDGRQLPPDWWHRGLSMVLTAIGALDDGARREGMSPLPLLAHFRHVIKHTMDSHPDLTPESAFLAKRLRAAIDQAARGAAPLTKSDVAYWADGSPSRHRKPRIALFFNRVGRLVKRGGARLGVIDELLRSASGIPPGQAIDAYVQLRRRAVPRRIALWLALRRSR